MGRLGYTLLFLAFAFAAGARAELVVVVNADSGVKELKRNEVVNIFMGRYRKLPSGVAAIPVDLVPLKERFYRALVKKELSEINAYWARLMFSGQTSPPQKMQTADDVRSVVRDNRGAISYVDRADLSDDVRVVFTLPEGSGG